MEVRGGKKSYQTVCPEVLESQLAAGFKGFLQGLRQVLHKHTRGGSLRKVTLSCLALLRATPAVTEDGILKVLFGIW